MADEAQPRDDGGPAFPVVDTVHNAATGETRLVYGPHGMSLRDYAAIHASEFDVRCALEDMGRDRNSGLNRARSGRERNAMARYAFADAMLKVRAE